jgi:transposase
MNNTVVGVDLAKDVIQVCLIKGNKEVSNEEMSYSNFNLWLSTHTSQTIVFEACGTSNYWKQRAVTLGHTAHLISAKLVASIRQNQKTDKNDALAIAQAALLPEVNFISGKNIEQQQLQSLMRLRELAVKQKVAMNNQLKALLLEFNIRISTRKGGLCEVIQSTLENADNDFSMPFRQALEQAFQQYLGIISSIKKYDTCIEQSLNQNNDCKRLMRLEGVGTINAVNLYITLGCSDFGTFKKGKDAAACIGLTPIQHSSGGTTKLGSIGRYVKNTMLRSQLITGAFAYINHVAKRSPKTRKEIWLKSLIERKGKKCAAVALANKTVRTAFSMLKNNTEYKAVLF